MFKRMKVIATAPFVKPVSQVLAVLLSGALFMVVAGSVQAKTYRAQLDQSQWYLSASIFECSIVHEIPRYGRGVFFHEAGEKLKFYTSVATNLMKPGKAALVIEGSVWNPGSTVRDLGFVPVVDESRPITVDRKSATVMMHGLLEGMTPTFTRKAWHKDESIRVQLNSINFASVYDGYLDCVAGLLPVNFNQVERTRVNFAVDKAELTKNDKAKLDNVVLYVNADTTVSGIFVDGHTDSSGRRVYNRRLSKARAETVTRYLVNSGLSEDFIRTRYHGERYPAVKNNTKKNKFINRRTTVRLVRGEELAPPSDDAADGALLN